MEGIGVWVGVGLGPAVCVGVAALGVLGMVVGKSGAAITPAPRPWGASSCAATGPLAAWGATNETRAAKMRIKVSIILI